MNTSHGYAYGEDEASPYDRGTIAAIFDSRDEAKHALQDLHDAGFHKTWMGVTSAPDAGGSELGGTYADAALATPVAAGEHTVESAEGGFGASLARFFGEDGRESLHEALTKRGVPSSDALALDRQIQNGGVVITVEANGRYDEVIQILRSGRGEIAGTANGVGPETASGITATVPTTTATAAATDSVDDARTLQLREERLTVDKDRVAAGEASIGKRVVTQDASVDVPVMHEELFIQRRPVADGTRAASGAIGDGETIRVPLMREQVVVDKRTVVTEEVAIGKRTVGGTERVDETVRHEELVVDDGTTHRETVPSERL